METSNEISIGDLAHLIAKFMNKKIEIIVDKQRIRPSEVDRLRCDNSKILKYTSWKPKYTFESGLKETIEWIKSNIHFYKHETYNI
jgi:nucleoside-diphosphate-sugar epimerase